MKIVIDNQDHKPRPVVGHSPQSVTWEDGLTDTTLEDALRAVFGLFVALGYSDYSVKSCVCGFHEEWMDEVEAVDRHLEEIRREKDLRELENIAEEEE